MLESVVSALLGISVRSAGFYALLTWNTSLLRLLVEVLCLDVHTMELFSSQA